MVVLVQKWLYSGKSGCICTKLLYSDKLVVLGHAGYICANVVVFGQKWLYFGKSGCIRAKVVVIRQSDCIPAKWLFSVKVVLFGQSGCIRAKYLYSGKIFIFGQKWL